MGKRTLSSCWKQYEKLADDYLAGDKDRAALRTKLEGLTDRANRDEVGAALVTLFVKPHINVPVGVEFTMNAGDATEGASDDGLPGWMTSFDEARAQILVHPVAVMRFVRQIRTMQVSEEDYEDFLHCRYKSFLVEVAKLPNVYLLFLAVLQRVAYLLQIAHLEKRGGVIEVAEGESYHTLLWAFKELEVFARRTYGVNIRAHYRISWYEADWITGR